MVGHRNAPDADPACLYGLIGDVARAGSEGTETNAVAIAANFMAYLSCELPADRIKAARASQVAVSRQGKIIILACHYDQGITFTHRSRRECTVVGDGHCAVDPTACRASCE